MGDDWVIRVQDGVLPSRSTVGYMTAAGVIAQPIDAAQRYTLEGASDVAARLKQRRPDLRFIVTSEAAAV